MTPDDRQTIFSHRQLAAVVNGIRDDKGVDSPIVGKSLGEAILFVSEEAGTDASNVHVVYGENSSLSYTDCLSVYRDFAASLRADARS